MASQERSVRERDKAAVRRFFAGAAATRRQRVQLHEHLQPGGDAAARARARPAHRRTSHQEPDRR
jgi:hypothetical protein